MGEIADDIHAEYWEHHCVHAHAPRGVWIDAQGDAHQMADMDTRHLTNACRFADAHKRAEIEAELHRRDIAGQNPTTLTSALDTIDPALLDAINTQPIPPRLQAICTHLHGLPTFQQAKRGVVGIYVKAQLWEHTILAIQAKWLIKVEDALDVDALDHQSPKMDVAHGALSALLAAPITVSKHETITERWSWDQDDPNHARRHLFLVAGGVVVRDTMHTASSLPHSPLDCLGLFVPPCATSAHATLRQAPRARDLRALLAWAAISNHTNIAKDRP